MSYSLSFFSTLAFLSIKEIDELEEGMIVDLIVESSNNLCSEEYREVATPSDFDAF